MGLSVDNLSSFNSVVGEMAWHRFTYDPNIYVDSIKEYEHISLRIQKYFSDKPLKILDLCCNNHIAGYLLKKENPHHHVTVCDLSTASMENGRNIAEAHGLPRVDEIIDSDFHNLPFKDNEFDLVIMFRAIHHTRHPENVFSEAMRVLNIGGVFSLCNEPVSRKMCTYSFTTNRVESLSKYEQILMDGGVLGALSYPTAGSRPEELFGMVENGNIPLEAYLNAFGSKADVVDRSYDSCSLTALEQELLKGVINGDIKNPSDVLPRLQVVFNKAKGEYSPKEKSMGLLFLSKELTLEVADMYYEQLKKIAFSISSEQYLDTLGGNIYVDYRKNESTQIIKNIHHDAQGLGQGGWLLHDIQAESHDNLKKIYSQKDWDVVEEVGSITSLLNKSERAYFNAPGVDHFILVIRFYGVEWKNLYKVNLHGADGDIKDSVIICRSETRLICAEFIDYNDDTLYLSITDMDNSPIQLPGHLRVGIIQAIRVKY